MVEQCVIHVQIQAVLFLSRYTIDFSIFSGPEKNGRSKKSMKIEPYFVILGSMTEKN